MRKTVQLLLASFLVLMSAKAAAQTSVFIYCPVVMGGLHVAAPDSLGKWHDLGQVCSSDYGTWGVEKRMSHPSLCRAADGTWRLVFQVNDRSPVFAAAYSTDLVTWRPQDYPRMSTRQCLKPVITPSADGFTICYQSEQGARIVQASTDFRHFSADQPLVSVDESLWRRDTVEVDRRKVTGQLFEVSEDLVANIRRHFSRQRIDALYSGERMHDDRERYDTLQGPATATLTVDMNSEKPISDKLIGIFFEDISYAADGGLYAELVQNRDFEYSTKDRKEWTATTAWHSPVDIVIADENPLTPQNPHYAVVRSDSLWNEGWDGITVEQGKKYDFSMFVRGKKNFAVQLIAPDGSTIAQAEVKAKGDTWKRYECVLTASRSETNARLLLLPTGQDEASIDMVSLFPQETFKNRKNGLRRDLAQVIADLHPKFVRFPGGCLTHGQGLENIYHWQHTIGELQDRTPDFNIWNYHQTRGLGFFEYFQFCEDIGAEPLPVLAAGVPCQNSANNAEGFGGQQGGIPMADMPAYIDELCHLVEWANGDPATNEWARKRAEAGHPAPFNLKYIGIGNEDIISTVFEERYVMICQALRERHPEIKICGTVGPFHTPSADYAEGWDLCRRHPELQYMTDEHYYESTGWFLHHRDYYDNYDRQGTKVYLGEWAASTKVKRPNVETALAEALYLTDIERNGDIVEMTSYAPLLCNDKHSNWNPDMIYFSNTDVRTTTAYEVQRMFSVNSGDCYVTSQLTMNDQKLKHRVGASIVRDSRTGKRYLKLINALPVTLEMTVNGLELPATVRCEQLSGGVEDQQVKAVVIETDQPTTLPPYTFRVIEL